MTDAALVLQARRGDAAAFEALVRRHFRAAYAVALAILGNRMDAEDVCQDSLLKALQRIEDCRDADKFVPWLLQIVRNQARNYIQYRRVRHAAPLTPDVAPAADNTAHPAERSDLRRQLEAALMELTELQRQVVLLHDLDGQGHSTIAASLGISEVASRQHLFVARRALRERLGNELLRTYVND